MQQASTTQPSAAGDRPEDRRFAVDEPAMLFPLHEIMGVICRLTEVSLSGCRVHMPRDYSAQEGQRAELSFRVHGVAFRVCVTVERSHPHRDLELCFAERYRRRDDLQEVLGELSADAVVIEPPGPALNASHACEPVPGRSVHGTPSQGGGATNSRCPSFKAGETQCSQPEQAPAANPSPLVSGKERRFQTRHSVNSSAAIFLVDVRCQIHGRILDVSLSGCRIRSEEKFPVGIYRRVEVEFSVDGLPFRLPGVVQSLHDRFTIGIRYLDLSDRKRQQLLALMQELDELGTLSAARPATPEALSGPCSAS